MLNNTGNTKRVVLQGGGINGNRGIFVGGNSNFDAQTIIGGWFFSDGSAREDYALTGSAVDGHGLVNVGVNASAEGASTSNIGLYAEICTPSAGLAAFFNGDLLVTGALYGSSDASLKTEVESLSLSHANKLGELRTYTYNYNQDIKALNLPSVTQYGLIAQEVTAVFPSIVDTTLVPRRYNDEGELLTDTMTHLNIDYLQFIALAVNTYQYQDSLILDNANKLNVLKNRLSELVKPRSNELKATSSETSLSGKALKKLNLYPNPAEDIIVIEFETDKSVDLIVLKIFDATGKIVIEEKEHYIAGLQTIKVHTSQLKAGIYELQLIANNIKETKIFVKK